MKKLFTLLILLGGVVLAQAQSLKIGGTSISLSGSSTITVSSSAIKSGTVKYNQVAKILYLDNATIEYDGDCITANVEGLIIDFKGTNKITSTSSKSNCAGIYIWGEDVNKAVSLRSNNSFDPASVTINNNGAGGSIITQGNRLDIFALIMSCKANQNHCIYVNTSSSAKAIFGPMYSQIDLIAPSGKAAVYGFTGGLYSSRNNINTIAWTDKSFKFSKDSGKGGFVNSGGNLVNSITIVPVLKIGKAFIDPSDFTLSTSNASALGLTDGTIKFTNSTKTLTFNGAKISNAAQIVTSYLPGLNIEATGTSTLTSTAKYGMSLYANTNFTGSGTLNVEATSSSFSGIKVFNSSDVTIKMKKIYVKGKYYGWSGSDGGTLTLSNNSNSDYYFEGTGYGALNAKNLVLEGMDYFYNTSYGTPGCYFDDGFVRQNGGNIVKGSNVVNFYKLDESDKYNIFVAGTQVTDNNRLAVGSKYITAGGSTAVTYDTSTKTLKLNGATITGPAVSGTVQDTDNTLCLGIEGLTVNVIGDNSISAASAKQTGLYIKADNVTISGTGNLNVTSTGSGAYGAQVAFPSHKLTIHSKGRVEFIGDTYGLAVGKLVLKKDAGETSWHYRFKSSASGAALWVKELTLDNVDFYSGTSRSEPTLHGCYWDPDASNMILQNGGSIAHGLVAFCGITTKYNLYVGNTQVTNCNAAGIGSKYIKAGGPTAVTFKDNTLTLNGAKIDLGSDAGNAIKNNTDNDLIINVTSVCDLKVGGAANSAIYFAKGGTGTIKGSGKLTVSSVSPSSIIAPYNGTLILDNIDMEVENNIVGWTDNKSTLKVKLTTPGKVIRVNGNVKDFGSLILDEGTKIVDPDGGYFSSSKYGVVKSDGSTLASPVVFADKTSTAIDGITTDADAEVIGIYDAQGRKLEEMQQGINIIRMSDGTTKKIIKK